MGRKCTIFALFYFVFEGKLKVQAPPPPGAYIWRSDLTEGFLRYDLGGLYLEGLAHGGAYFRNFTVDQPQKKNPFRKYSNDGDARRNDRIAAHNWIWFSLWGGLSSRPFARWRHFTTTTCDPNPSGFCFLVQFRGFIIETSLGLLNLNVKGKTSLRFWSL